MSRKVLLVSSKGGHWIQLKRIVNAFKNDEIAFLSTFEKVPSLSGNDFSNYFAVVDASRWNKILLVKQLLQVTRVVFAIKPRIIVTTGASIGVWAIIAGRLIGSKTVWIDSIANYERMSLSGRLVKPFVNIHLTQWEHLAMGKTCYKGTVL